MIYLNEKNTQQMHVLDSHCAGYPADRNYGTLIHHSAIWMYKPRIQSRPISSNLRSASPNRPVQSMHCYCVPPTLDGCSYWLTAPVQECIIHSWTVLHASSQPAMSRLCATNFLTCSSEREGRTHWVP